MARIKYSALVSDMRNSLNGSVLSKNRAGNYIRNKVTPVNPQTSYQQAVRSLFASLSSQWKGLTNDQRASWRAATANFPYTDIFGDQKELDGKSLYVKLNTNLVNAGEQIIQTAPVGGSIPESLVNTVDAAFYTDSTPFLLETTLLPTGVPTGYAALFYATDPVPPQIGFVKNRFRLVMTKAAGSGAIDASTAYVNRFYSPTAADAGKIIHVRVALVDIATGQMGVASGGSAVIEQG